MAKRKLFYLASPYSHPEQAVRDERFKVVQKATIDLLLEHNLFLFSPIAYNHPMVEFDLPTDWNFWQEYDKAFVDHCDALVVLKIDGWEKSVGVAAEVEYSKEIGVPVLYLTLEDIQNGNVSELLKLANED